MPTYQYAIVTDTLTCYPWDGSKGGILALFVNDTLNIESIISVTVKGFRGADTTVYTGGCLQLQGRRNYSGSATDSAGLKGEGMIRSNFDLIRGYGGIANAGGGGDGEYSGGGGGAGYGFGGYGGQEATICSDPGTSNNSISSGGEGGHSVKPDFGNETDSVGRDRIFPGGGGGAGSGPPNSPGTLGGNGGGIVYIITRYLKTNGSLISSNGGSVSEVTKYSAGAGGGGGGGSVILATDSVKGSLNIQVNGGNGGSTQACSGQGGGGGGGFFWTTLPDSGFYTSNISRNPGSAGTTIGDCLNTTLFADSGSFATNLNPVLNGFLFNIIGGASAICQGSSPNEIGGSTPRGGNGVYNYQWQSKTNTTNWANIAGANQLNYSSVPLYDTTYFRRIVTSLRFKGDPDSSDIVTDTSKFITILINAVSPVLSVSKNTLNLTASLNSNATFTIYSNETWTLVNSKTQTWLTPNVTSGSDTTLITLTATANDSAKQRIDTITVSGCGVTGQKVIVIQAAESGTAIINITDNDINLYPVPVVNNLIISYPNPQSHTSFAIYNLNGLEMYTSTMTNSITTVDMSKYASGVYIIKIILPDNRILTRKIIKQ